MKPHESPRINKKPIRGDLGDSWPVWNRGISPLKWRECGCGLNRFVHEGMNHISNVEVHLKARSGNINISKYLYYAEKTQTRGAESPHRSYITITKELSGNELTQ